MTRTVVLIIVALWAASSLAYSNTITVPFQLVDKLIVIEATADGKTGNFILDTGNSYLVLNVRHFRGERSGENISGIGGHSVAVYATRTNLEIGKQKWWNRQAVLSSLDHLERNKGTSFLGIIGTDLLTDYLLTIDYQAQVISLRKAGRKDPSPVNDHNQRPDAILKFYLKAGIPIITARLESTKLQFVLDTGAEINLLDAAAAEDLRDHFQSAGTARLTDMIRQGRKVQTGNLYNLRIADQICPKLEVAVHSLKHLNQHTPKRKGDLDGLIGYEFLSQFRVAFHFKKQVVYLWRREGREGVLVAAE